MWSLCIDDEHDDVSQESGQVLMTGVLRQQNALLVPQALDGIQAGGYPRWPDSEHQAHKDRHTQAGNDCPKWNS